MYRQFTFAVVMTAALAGIAAAASTWTNTGGDNDWCDANNWSPVGLPTSGTTVTIDGSPNDTVVVTSGCVAEANEVFWTVNSDQTFSVENGGSITIQDGFRFNWGAETAIVRIAGDFTTGREGDKSFRAPNTGTGIVYIEPGANIYTAGRIRGADETGSFFEVYMSGGYVDCNAFKLGDDGSGNFYMTGGKFITRKPGEQSFTIRGREAAEFKVLIDGGAELYVEGYLMTPQEPNAIATINIDNGTISCDEWVAQGDLWVVDINEGQLRIRDSNGTTKAKVEQWIADGRITGYNGTLVPQITWDGPDLVLTVDFIHLTAYAPDPPDDGLNVCPDANLIWSPGVYVADHNIYFGTDMNEANESAVPKVIHWGPNEWDPGVLALNTTYYWRIDTVNDACAPGLWAGGIWDFTTSDGNAFAVSPKDGQTNVLITSDLEWGACTADSYDVYFSTDVNAVANRLGSASLGNTAATTIDPCAGNLEYATDYYWMIDKIEGAVTAPGQVWTFKTENGIVDVNMVLWYKLDETDGNAVSDSSGYENHGEIYGVGDWRPDEGRFGGSMRFDDSAKIAIYPLATANISSQMSVSCWLKDAGRPESDNWVFGFNYGDYQFRAAVVLENTTEVEFRAGNDSHDVLIWNMSHDDLNPSTLQDWHHWVFVKDEDAGNMRIHFDGEVVEANDVVDSTLTNIRVRPAAVGAVPNHSKDFVGQVDDFRIYDKALSDNEVSGIFRGGEVEIAWSPDPRNGAVDVDANVVLSWRPGDFAVEHEVYIGNTFSDVNDADTTTAGIYKGRQIDTNYPLGASLPLGSTRYWRIDEVNTLDPNSPWKGEVWKFTVADYIIIDDFEDYDSSSNPIFDTWEDGNVNFTGSFLDLGAEPFDPAHGGIQSMQCIYDNTIKWDWDHYWSEVELPFSPAKDFTSDGLVKVLTLYFYGDPDNDASDTEELYVGLTGSLAEVRYSDDHGNDNNDLKLQEWTEWNIPLSDFSGVDPCVVTGLLIGFGDRDNTDAVGGDGIVLFDDIRLYPARCVPELRAFNEDLSGRYGEKDCIINYYDVEAIADEWLRTDACLPTTLPSPGPVAHWQFEEGDSNSVSDSANSHHGVAEGDYAWVEGKIGSWAMEFSGGRVLVPDHAQLRPQTAVSATAWVFISESQDHGSRVVVKGADNAETYALQVNNDDEASLIIRDSDPCGPTMYDVRTDAIYFNEWMHLAGVCSGDTNTLNIYVNGQLAESVNDANFMEKGLTLSQDTNDLAIGSRSDATNGALQGVVDDTRIYDRALTDAEVAWLATEGGGYWSLELPANLYDEEPAEQKAINIRDLAVVLNVWLEERLWPQ